MNNHARIHRSDKKRRKFTAYLLPVALGLLLSACATAPSNPSGTPSALDPRGPGAAQLAELGWIMYALAALVSLLVTVLLFAALFRRRRQAEISSPPNEFTQGSIGTNWIIWGGIVLPIVVLGVVFGFTMQAFASISGQEAQVNVEVVGRRWWWQITYEGQDGEDVVTANELHIPVGVPVEVTLLSADVIHSFWVPQLHGKMDLIPGVVNSITIQADEPGVYRGLCAEFCGVQHTLMNFMVVAQSQEEFDAWLEAQAQPAPLPQDSRTMRGQQVFVEAGCVYCHQIQGLDDSAVDASEVDLGPDLTHLNSRMTIAAGSLLNNRGNLAGWIANAQHVKPGSLMPPTFIAGEDLNALLAYLETLD